MVKLICRSKHGERSVTAVKDRKLRIQGCVGWEEVEEGEGGGEEAMDVD